MYQKGRSVQTTLYTASDLRRPIIGIVPQKHQHSLNIPGYSMGCVASCIPMPTYEKEKTLKCCIAYNKVISRGVLKKCSLRRALTRSIKTFGGYILKNHL